MRKRNGTYLNSENNLFILLNHISHIYDNFCAGYKKKCIICSKPQTLNFFVLMKIRPNSECYDG